VLGAGGITGALPPARQPGPARGAAEHRRGNDEQQPDSDRGLAVQRTPAAQRGREPPPR